MHACMIMVGVLGLGAKAQGMATPLMVKRVGGAQVCLRACMHAWRANHHTVDFYLYMYVYFLQASIGQAPARNEDR